MVYDMVHDLRKNTVVVQVFFCGARLHQKSTQVARNIVHPKYRAPKFQILRALTPSCKTKYTAFNIKFIMLSQ